MIDALPGPAMSDTRACGGGRSNFRLFQNLARFSAGATDGRADGGPQNQEMP
jgi:hypothetical protein